MNSIRLTAHQVFDKLDAYRVVADLKLPLEEKEGMYITPHPQFPAHHFHVQPKEFIGAGLNSPTPACNVFDFLALHFESYEQSMDWVIDHYFHLAPPGIALGSIRDHLVRNLKAERQQFDDVLALREPFRTHSEYLGEAYIRCRGRELEPESAWRMFYVNTGQEINKVLRYAVAPVEPLKPDEQYWIYPYMKNRHTFGFLKIEDADGKPIRSIRFNPSRFLFFGLHSCLADSKQIRVFGTREETLKVHSHAWKMGNFNIGFLHVLCDGASEAIAPPLNLNGAVLVETETTDFNTIAKLRSAFNRLEIAGPQDKYAENLMASDWEPYALNRIIKAINEDENCTPRILAMVQSISCFPDSLGKLLNYFERTGERALVQSILQQLGPTPLFTHKEVQVVETPTAYAIRNASDGLASPFTNFLLRIDTSIRFAESDELYFSGRIIINGTALPFLISEAETHQPKAILAQALRAATHAGTRVPLPTIRDPALEDALVPLIRLQLAQDIPKIRGIQRLGWDLTKSRFVTPAWEASHSGVQPSSKILHPGATLAASYFLMQDSPTGGDFGKVTAQACHLIALLAAGLTRAFLNQQIPLVRLIRNASSSKLLQAVFRPFGQRAPVELSSERGLIKKALSAQNFFGYPLYVTSPDPSALEEINYPLFLLGRSGMAPPKEQLDSEVLSQVSSLSHRVITSLVLSLIREPLEAQDLIPNEQAPPLDELAQEGQRIIETKCQLKQFRLRDLEMPRLAAALSSVPLAALRKYFRYDRGRGVVRFRCPLQGITRKPLFEELAAKNPQVSSQGDHYIVCPAEWFKELLATFYGQPLNLDEQLATHQVGTEPSPAE